MERKGSLEVMQVINVKILSKIFISVFVLVILVIFKIDLLCLLLINQKISEKIVNHFLRIGLD